MDTTRYLSGVILIKKILPVRRPVILLLVLTALFLSACGVVQSTNWPGLASDGGDVVYVSYGPGIVAVDIEREEELWIYTSGQGNSAPPVYAPPSLNDGRLIVGDYGASGGFLSPRVQVNVYSLQDIYESNPVQDWTLSDRVQDRIVAQALQVGDRAYLGTNDNFVFALNAANGDPAWPEPFEAQHSIWGQMSYEDGILYVPSLDTNVYALDADTGQEFWSSNVGGSVSDKLVINDNLIFAGSFDKKLYALSKEDGSVRWTVPTEASIWGAPAYDNGVVYFSDINGNVKAVEATSGEIIWESTLGQYVVAAPVFAEGKIFIASGGDPELDPNERDGALIALDAGSGDELWRDETQLPLFATPVIAADSIVVVMNGQDLPLELVAFDLADLNSSWTYTPSSQG